MTPEERQRRRLLEMWGTMEVVATDQGAGRQYRCACGTLVWSAWGHARRHARECPKSGRVPFDEMRPARPPARSAR